MKHGNSSELRGHLFFTICNTDISNSKCLSRKLDIVKDHAIISKLPPAREPNIVMKRYRIYEVLDNQHLKIQTEVDDKHVPQIWI